MQPISKFQASDDPLLWWINIKILWLRLHLLDLWSTICHKTDLKSYKTYVVFVQVVHAVSDVHGEYRHFFQLIACYAFNLTQPFLQRHLTVLQYHHRTYANEKPFARITWWNASVLSIKGFVIISVPLIISSSYTWFNRWASILRSVFSRPNVYL